MAKFSWWHHRPKKIPIITKQSQFHCYHVLRYNDNWYAESCWFLVKIKIAKITGFVYHLKALNISFDHTSVVNCRVYIVDFIKDAGAQNRSW